MAAEGAPYRVIQWATGSVGREALRAILMHPALELAGVLVHSAAKSGKDAGELCGEPATGVVATRDVDAILACEADCVVYAPRQADVEEVCALLRSGKSVVCTPFLFHRGGPQGDANAERIEKACREGRSAVHGTGIHPGFVGMVLPVALSGMSRTIERHGPALHRVGRLRGDPDRGGRRDPARLPRSRPGSMARRGARATDRREARHPGRLMTVSGIPALHAIRSLVDPSRD